jgi:hypothetical protein
MAKKILAVLNEPAKVENLRPFPTNPATKTSWEEASAAILTVWLAKPDSPEKEIVIDTIKEAQELIDNHNKKLQGEG